MIPSAFDYVKAGSIAEAISLLEAHEDGKLLAGGHSLIPMMKLRLAAPTTLIDIADIPDLGSIAVDGDRITIGALTKHAALTTSDALKAHAPALWDAAKSLGDPQVRNRGTIGGASAHGDPSADYPAVLHVLDATFTVVGKGGQRDVQAGDFFRGMFDTALDRLEVLTQIAFNAAPKSAYLKYDHPASHYAVVGAAVALTMDGGKIASARVAVTGVGDAAFRAGAVERALAGVDPTDAAAVKAACTGAAAGIDSRSDVFATGAYRVAMADIYVARAVAYAASR